MDGSYNPYLDGDPRPLDNRTPPNSPHLKRKGSLMSPEGLKTPWHR